MTDDNPVRDILDAREQRAAYLLAAFDAADPAQRRAVQLVQYRCKLRGCDLLTCWQAAGWALVRLPRFKMSHARNDATSVEAARKKNTSDGGNHWNARALVLDDLDDPAFALSIKCDHYDAVVPALALAAEAASATPGHPVRRFF